MTSPLWNLFIVVGIGIVAVSVIDLIGSISSRWFNFNYSKLAAISYFVYIQVAFFIALKSNFISTVSATFLVGIYDATAGHYISEWFSANWGELKETVESMDYRDRMLVMLVTSIIMGLIGFLLAQLFK